MHRCSEPSNRSGTLRPGAGVNHVFGMNRKLGAQGAENGQARDSASALPAAGIAVFKQQFFFFESPLLTIPAVAEQCRVTYPTAASAVEKLVKRKILTPGPMNRRPRYFYAPKIFTSATLIPDKAGRGFGSTCGATDTQRDHPQRPPSTEGTL